jgi:hypothetical protein
MAVQNKAYDSCSGLLHFCNGEETHEALLNLFFIRIKSPMVTDVAIVTTTYTVCMYIIPTLSLPFLQVPIHISGRGACMIATVLIVGKEEIVLPDAMFRKQK